MSGVMDWHAWLSAARLEPALVHEYALVLARNELEAGDAAYFDHEFLRCMGISVAKHRLEILKLASPRSLRRSSSVTAASLSRILASVDRAARYVRSLVRRRGQESSAALVLVPCQQQHDGLDVCRAGSSSGYYKAPKRTRSKPKSAAAAAPRSACPAGGCRGAATVHAMRDVQSGGDDTVKWDRMFQGLNPN